MEIVNYADVNVDDDNIEYIVKYDYEEGQEDKEIQEDQEDQEVPQYEEDQDQNNKEDENGHLTLFDVDVGHNVINFYLQNFKKVVVYYPVPDYITTAKKEFAALSEGQRMEVFALFKRQFAIEGIKNIYEGINSDCSLRTFLSRLMGNISRKLRDKKMHKPDINLYLEVLQNIATIISNKAHPRGGYRRKVKQTRRNRRRARNTHKRNV